MNNIASYLRDQWFTIAFTTVGCATYLGIGFLGLYLKTGSPFGIGCS